MPNWYDGELFPVAKEFVNAPVGVMLREDECTHDHTFVLKHYGEPAMGRGKICLWCHDCQETWWEDGANIQGSPWAVAK